MTYKYGAPGIFGLAVVAALLVSLVWKVIDIYSTRNQRDLVNSFMAVISDSKKFLLMPASITMLLARRLFRDNHQAGRTRMRNGYQ